MKITDVRINLIKNRGERSGEAEKKMVAIAVICFDNELAVHEVKVIAGREKMLVAMPQRKLNDRCPRCHCRTALIDKFCGQCGQRLLPLESRLESRGPSQNGSAQKNDRDRLFADIVHPVNQNFRELLTRMVLERYEETLRGEPPSV